MSGETTLTLTLIGNVDRRPSTRPARCGGHRVAAGLECAPPESNDMLPVGVTRHTADQEGRTL